MYGDAISHNSNKKNQYKKIKFMAFEKKIHVVKTQISVETMNQVMIFLESIHSLETFRP